MTLIDHRFPTAAAAPFRTPGHSLPGDLYTSPEAYERDLAAVFGRTWVFVGSEAEVPEPGDYLTIDIDRRSVLVVRDDDEVVRAFHNVCRHRGSRLLDDCSGSVGNIVCPYHQWTYDTAGDLLYAESSGPGFDRTALSLRPVHLRSVAGLLFICLAEQPPADVDHFASVVTPYLTPHGIPALKVATQVDIVEDGNWKLVMENNRECVHCGGHPDLSGALFPVYGYAPEDVSPRLRPAYDRYQRAHAALVASCEPLGLRWEAHEDLTRAMGFRIEREPLDGAGESFTVDGSLACRVPILHPTQTRLGRLSLHVQPNAWFHAVGDHVVTFSVLPLGPDRTRVRTTWLVHADAEEGTDYDLATLTDVWRHTNEEDRVFVARTHQGVADPAYVPGPYLPPEYQVDAFCTWYVDRLDEHARR